MCTVEPYEPYIKKELFLQGFLNDVKFINVTLFRNFIQSYANIFGILEEKNGERAPQAYNPQYGNLVLKVEPSLTISC